MPSTVTALRSFDDVSLPPPVASAGAAPPNKNAGRERGGAE